MYKMIKAVGHDGVDKLDYIASIHSLYGYFYVKPVEGGCICFVYDDNSEKMMRSSTIEKITMDDNVLKIATRNSEYWFMKITKLEEE